MNQSTFLVLACAVSAFGSAVTWTGLPIFVARQTGDSSRLGDLFILYTLSSLMFSYIGGWGADKRSCRKLASGLNLVAAAFIIIISQICRYGKFDWLQSGMFLLFACTAVIDVVQTQWLFALAKESKYESMLANRMTAIAIAKVLGMAMGPLLFDKLKYYGLIVDALSFIAAALLQLAIKADRKIAHKTDSSFSFERPKSVYILNAVLVGATGFPLTFAMLATLNKNSPSNASMFSLFWFCSGIFFVASGTFAKTLLKWLKSPKGTAQLLSGVLALSLCLFSVASDSILRVLAFGLVVLVSPGLSILVQSQFIRDTKTEKRGRTSATLVLIEQIVALTVLFVMQKFDVNQLAPAALFLIFLVLIRAVVATRVLLSRIAPATSAAWK